MLGSTYFNHGLVRASSAEHRLAGSSSNILSIKSRAVLGKLKQNYTRLYNIAQDTIMMNCNENISFGLKALPKNWRMTGH